MRFSKQALIVSAKYLSAIDKHLSTIAGYGMHGNKRCDVRAVEKESNTDMNFFTVHKHLSTIATKSVRSEMSRESGEKQRNGQRICYTQVLILV